jgi:hypothetical protein
LLCGFFIITLSLKSVYAQNLHQKETQDKQRLEEETRRDLSKTETEETKEKRFTFDWGGSLSNYYWGYYNDDNDRASEDLLRHVTYISLRLWFKMTMFKKHIAYVRTSDSYIFRRDTSPDYTGEGDDHDGPSIDMAYLNFAINPRLRLIVGRQYLTLGKGIAYNKTHDGIQLKGSLGQFMFKAFASRTKPRENNLDYSIPGYKKHGHKMFYGAELAYIRNLRIVPYIFVLFQDDFPDETPEDTAQNYGYDSRYYGLGLSAEATKNLDWWFEAIREEGKSYTDSDVVPLEKKRIDAWAGVMGCQYKFNTFAHPRAEFEVAYGSGDKDRTRVTNTDGGNLYDEDENFLYYGYYFAGYALSPRLSNIIIYRVGLSGTPFEKTKLGRNIVLGAKFYIYRKDKAGGGIYDTDATRKSKDIGKEINVYMYWRLNRKTTWVLRYGKFFTGKAYDEDTDANSQYVYSRINVRF